MEEPKVLISKKSIRTMGKDMVRLKRDDIDLGKNGEDEKKALAEEMKRRGEEEARLKSLRMQGNEVIKSVEKKEDMSVEDLKKKEEERFRIESVRRAKKMAVFQEARKKAEGEKKKQDFVPAAIPAEKPEKTEKTEKTEDKTGFISSFFNRKKGSAMENNSEGIKEDFLKDKKAVANNLKELDQKRAFLEERKKNILKEKEKLEALFKEIEEKDVNLAREHAKIEEMEAAAKSSEDKRGFEKDRWRIEEERKNLEKNRWPLDEKKEQMEADLRSIEKKERDMAVEKEKIALSLEEISKREKSAGLRAERLKLLEEINRNKVVKNSFEAKTNELFKKLEENKGNLNIILNKEREIEEKEKKVELQVGSVKNLSERRELEKTRWQIEDERRNIESKRWDAEAIVDKSSQELRFSQGKLKEILSKSEKASGRLNEIDKLLSQPTPKTQEEPKAIQVQNSQPDVSVHKDDLENKSVEEKLRIIEDERRAKIEEARKRIEILKRVAFEKKQRQEQIKKAVLPPVAKQKLFSRPVKFERGEENKRRNLLERLNVPISAYNKKNEEKEIAESERKSVETLNSQEIIRVVPKKPSFREKLWVRSLIVAVTLVVLAGILTFWYWYFVIRTSTPLYPPGYEKEKEGIQISPSLFNVGDTTIITITKDEELKDAIQKVLDNSFAEGQFKRIVIKKDGEILGLKDIFSILLIDLNDGFYNNIVDEPTMFVYSQGQGNRFGFIVKLSGNLSDMNIILKSMEPTMEIDFGNLFALMGNHGDAIAPYFKDSSAVNSYDGIDFRFKTLNQNDLGIFYAVSDFYFAFSSSWESMSNLLDNTEDYLSDKALIGDLKIGDSGAQVSLLQKWLAKSLNIYESNLVSGVFDAATKDAVITFQEKYKAEILTPQGRNLGTGIADLATRRKLNQLYSKL